MKQLVLLFFVRVLIPMHVTNYDDVVSWEQTSPEIYTLTLYDGRKVIAPTMWTIIEQR